MATLGDIRAALNGELGVSDDAETTPWSPAVRNQAIADGYAALYRAGVWKPVSQTVATASDTWLYPLTEIRRLNRIEILDSSGFISMEGRALVEDDYAGGYQLRLVNPVGTGGSLRVRGWTAYKSVFTSDLDTDDLPAEHGRLPRLKAKSILWREQLGLFARYGERQAIAPEMTVSLEGLLALIAAAEREFAEECRALSNLRPRSGQSRRV